MSDIFNYIKELTKFELIYKDENNVPQTARSYIKRVSDDGLLVDPPSINGRVKNIKDGTKVKMVVYAEEGAYSGESSVISKELSSVISGVWLSYPRSSQAYQRREYLRAPLHKDFKIYIYKDKEQTQRTEMSAVTRDLSGKGLSFIHDEPLKDYYNIECVIPLNDEQNNIIKVVCEHIYTKPTIIDGQTKYIHALAFVNLKDKYMDLLVNECFQCQLTNRK